MNQPRSTYARSTLKNRDNEQGRYPTTSNREHFYIAGGIFSIGTHHRNAHQCSMQGAYLFDNLGDLSWKISESFQTALGSQRAL